MKKNISFLLFLLSYCSFHAQQITQYSQYMLNTAAINPAATGFSSQTEILFGRRNQWIGFDNAPQVTFISAHRGFGKRVYKNFWHGAGLYIEEDKAGLYTTKQILGNYAFHITLTKGLKLAFGVGIGMRIYSFTDNQSLTSGDPAFPGGPYIIPLFPDLSSGIRIYSKKISVDVSAKQLYYNEVKYKNKRLGNNSRLLPHVFVTLSKKYQTEDYFYIFIPSLHIKAPVTATIPSATAGGMLLINRRVGVGLYARYPDAAYGVLQVRIVKNILIGVAYDYSLGPLHAVNANSVEIMVGISPAMSYDGFRDKPDKVLCPDFVH